jgi:hypothetical protein
MGKANEQERLHRFQKIISMVRLCQEEGIEKEKLIANFMVNYGIARRTMLEYIQALKMSERIIIDKYDLIYLSDEQNKIIDEILSV